MANANSYTTTDLLNNILLVGHLPTGNNTFTAANAINLADRELQTAIVGQIMRTRGGYYLTYTDNALTADGLYQIPRDSIAGTLENVEIVDNSGVIPVSLIDSSEQFSTDAPTSNSFGFYMRGNYVQIMPPPSMGSARLWYYRRPSRLVPTNLAAQVTGINADVLSVTAVPAQMLIGVNVDAIGDQPPFNVLATNTIVDVTGTDITLSAPVTGLSIGDWLALENQTPVPQIPVEFRPLLEQRVVVKIYELQGYSDKMKMAQQKLSELEQSLATMITPRVKSKTKVIRAINGGFLSAGNRFGRFPVGN